MSMLSQAEIDALVNQLAAPEPGALPEMRKVKTFDFRFNKRLDKFSTNQLQTLRTLHDNFTRLLNNSLSVYLRTRVEATVVSIDQITYGDFVSSIGDPSILSIFSMDPLPGSGMVQVDLNLVFSVIDRLLGGPGWFPQKLRDLTDIERTLMQRFMARMLNSYREAWNYLLTLSLKIEALDSNPQFIPRIIPLDQIVAFVTCELKVGDMTGVMNFCLPYQVLQQVGTQLSDFQWSPSITASRGMTEQDIALLARNVERAPVDVRVELGKTVVSLRDLIALQPGDLVMFDKSVTEPLAATVNDREKFKVFPGVNRDKLAVRVSQIIEDEE
ncbi:MAG: flagellar motor switch protein FliM [Candidatus Eremiobacteraeota bacterium]|jgi:flagellar motor switch protein FliM|nr:flagellar motor switch protein FliM [Candidatus Eremiobacteraeota bacterium]